MQLGRGENLLKHSTQLSDMDILFVNNAKLQLLLNEFSKWIGNNTEKKEKEELILHQAHLPEDLRGVVQVLCIFNCTFVTVFDTRILINDSKDQGVYII
ncbi:CLUMA_CG011290, isoform A [Clunio marinus]|uniref:CLUMA_CG011290, isoform A n=1 Tax=Clunio marinus TaxID=568069 RepID=A0A1J1ICJ2_9DIPT|nr:CLUMA_CG011290, isoform A [Clunio marinus]